MGIGPIHFLNLCPDRNPQGIWPHYLVFVLQSLGRDPWLDLESWAAADSWLLCELHETEILGTRKDD